MFLVHLSSTDFDLSCLAWSCLVYDIHQRDDEMTMHGGRLDSNAAILRIITCSLD